MALVRAATAVRRGDVYLVELNPARGREIRKTRPCVVVSPDELNTHLGTFIIAPLTTGSHPYPFRLPCRLPARAVIWSSTRSARSIAPGSCGGWGPLLRKR